MKRRINIQQAPKNKEYLSCFVAAPGHKLIYSDISALEPHIAAHFSQDKTLMALYGKQAKPNDVYLFVGAKTSELGNTIRAYYDPDNPTNESIEFAKERCKK